MSLTGFLGLGANLGDRRAALQRAVDALQRHGVTVRRSSSVYETDPVGLILDQPAFLNAVLEVETALAPDALLDAVKAVEDEAGRDHSARRHAPRTLDVDILLLGSEPIDSERLHVPHAALRERRFVLVPLLELDFEAATPEGRPLSEALAALPLSDGVVRHGPPLRVP